MKRFVTGDLYRPVFVGWYDLPKGVDYRHPKNRAALEAHLSGKAPLSPGDSVELINRSPYAPYVFYDRGTFSKRLRFYVVDGYDKVLSELGAHSESTIISVFHKLRISENEVRRHSKLVKERLEDLGFKSSLLKLVPEKGGIYHLHQTKLPI
jgi:hypothetical protein